MPQPRAYVRTAGLGPSARAAQLPNLSGYLAEREAQAAKDRMHTRSSKKSAWGQPNHVHVIPPDRHLAIPHRNLQLMHRRPPAGGGRRHREIGG